MEKNDGGKMIVNAISVLDRALLADNAQNLKSFLRHFRGVTSWFVLCDYCLDDKSKQHDTACFTIMPCLAQLDIITSHIDRLAPQDIKKSRQVSAEFIDFLRSGAVYNVCIILKKFNALVSSAERARNHCDDIIEMYRSFIMSSPENTECFERVIKDVAVLREETKKKSFSFKLMNRILFVSLVAGYFANAIFQYTCADTVTWLPDRDKITESYNRLCCNLFHAQCFSLGGHRRMDMSHKQIGIGIPNENELWFDILVRIPDHIAGSFAGWDMVRNNVSDKHLPMIEKFAADNPYLMLLEYGLEETEGQRHFKNHFKIISIHK